MSGKKARKKRQERREIRSAFSEATDVMLRTLGDVIPPDRAGYLRAQALGEDIARGVPAQNAVAPPHSKVNFVAICDPADPDWSPWLREAAGLAVAEARAGSTRFTRGPYGAAGFLLPIDSEIPDERSIALGITATEMFTCDHCRTFSESGLWTGLLMVPDSQGGVPLAVSLGLCDSCVAQESPIYKGLSREGWVS